MIYWGIKFAIAVAIVRAAFPNVAAICRLGKERLTELINAQRELERLTIALREAEERHDEMMEVSVRATQELESVRTRMLELEERAPVEHKARAVGLDPEAPKFVIEAARRVWRERYHPDRHSNAQDKAKALKRFQENEQLFQVLLRSAK